MSASANPVDLVRIFADWNMRSFDGSLPRPILRFNSRLQSTAGRFMITRNTAIIEIATYLLHEENAVDLIYDTLGHEMIHYWLWVQKKPYGHTREFWEKMEEMGVSRFNPVPKHRPFKHEYKCPNCERIIQTRKKMGRAACAECCKDHSDGQFDSRFLLQSIA